MNKNFVRIVLFLFSFSSLAGTLLFPDTQKSSVRFQTLNDLRSLGVNLDPSEFVLKDTKTGLLGKYLTFQKVLNGHEVDSSEVVISLNSMGQVTKVYHDLETNSQKMVAASVPMISQNMALESVWKKLNVNGRLINQPEVTLLYQKDLTLVYRIRLSVSSPAGHFVAMVNATNGNILSVKDAALPREKRKSAVIRLPHQALFPTYSQAIRAFEVGKVKSLSKFMTTASGTAQIFDPNPSVTLGRSDLQDDSPASAFTHAYKVEDLNSISSEGGVFHLSGPKITLKDFESPDVAPTASPDGHWIFERGNSGFTDAMTYFHIDQSIRYIESLGFKGNHVIFNHVMEVDSDGLYGDDNSHYVPYSKQLAFGHGCVDDNEDSEVILHELGHAIQDHINPQWSGGDTGAMGEGFGDYWAASYSATTEHGMEGNVNWVFKFDGHNDCWPGRKLDSYTPKYNPSTTYQPHAQVNGGVSDELWSTPIFQAFLEMYKSGVPKADIDKIILEAHFGLGSGLKMPDMAKSIVKTAKALFPKANYDQIYLKHFKKVGIL